MELFNQYLEEESFCPELEIGRRNFQKYGKELKTWKRVWSLVWLTLFFWERTEKMA